MKILSIETSCDETAISLVDAHGEINSPLFSILANEVFSQIDLHKEFGGVYPMIAKREHAKNLPILFKKILIDSKMYIENVKNFSDDSLWNEVKEILSKEEELYFQLKNIFNNISKPTIDAIAVTSGPGLEPALWVGISFAKALSKIFDVPLIPINHMEGHIMSTLIANENKKEIAFPAIALLISGGHTELVKISNWGKYEIIGATLDDAVGEAFDKVARMLGLPYPGGPEISKLAEEAREKNIPRFAKFTRPMINSNNLNFSFSGLKTNVLYYLRDKFNDVDLDYMNKMDIAREFEDTVVDVLASKTRKAIENINPQTLIVAGGVIANKKIRSEFLHFENEYNNLQVRIPTNMMSTDNSLMIACAAYFNISLDPELLKNTKKIEADGNLKLN